MDRILTLLIALVISLAPVTPSEAGNFHAVSADNLIVADAMPRSGSGHTHEAGSDARQEGESRADSCSRVISHCVAALAPPLRNVLPAKLTLAANLMLGPEAPGEGVFLTSEPPPPRA